MKIYWILCKDYNEHYIGATQRNLQKKIYEHNRLIKMNDDRNALSSQMLELKYIFSFSQTTQNQPIHYKNPEDF